ncbi:MAG: redoxin domain-containing protein [Gammaproteobacteria bacterium]|nr:redoxin domain-containing protein [Gammaproteobacteria bacterium]
MTRPENVQTRAAPPAVGTPAPWFTCRTTNNDKFVFDTVGGRNVVLFFFESAADPVVAAILAGIRSAGRRFDDTNVCCFGVSADPEDERTRRVSDSIPGIRIFWDFDRDVAGKYGVVNAGGSTDSTTFVLDPRLRVHSRIPVEGSAALHVQQLLGILDGLESIGTDAVAAPQAPVLVVPRIFEPQLCRRLMDYYDANEPRDSGFMRDVDGKTVQIIDYGHKRRRDCTIEDEALRHACMVRIHDRLAPEIQKAFHFQPTRMERYIIACYEESERGHFQPHRDNTTRGTAHRRFAVSLFLNSGEYEGGYLRFPEFGRALYTAPAGGAVVFSCSLLHEATPVTRGRRMMFLPFLYDDDARRIREENFQYLDSTTAE